MKKKHLNTISNTLILLGFGIGIPIWFHGIVDMLKYPYGLDGIIATAKEVAMPQKILTDEQALSFYFMFAAIPTILLAIGLYFRKK